MKRIDVDSDEGTDWGAVARRVRAHFGLSQRELAQELGISSTSTWLWEAKKTRPQRQSRVRLSEMLAEVEAAPPRASDGPRPTYTRGRPLGMYRPGDLTVATVEGRYGLAVVVRDRVTGLLGVGYGYGEACERLRNATQDHGRPHLAYRRQPEVFGGDLAEAPLTDVVGAGLVEPSGG